MRQPPASLKEHLLNLPSKSSATILKQERDSVLQCAAVWWCVLQSVGICCTVRCVLKYVALWCTVMHCDALCCTVVHCTLCVEVCCTVRINHVTNVTTFLNETAASDRVSRYDEVYCTIRCLARSTLLHFLPCVLLYVEVFVYYVLQRAAMCCTVLQCVAVCCSVVQCGAVWCRVLQCVVVWQSSWNCHQREVYHTDVQSRASVFRDRRTHQQ